MKQLLQQIQLEKHTLSPGFQSAGIRSVGKVNLDPFLNLDLFNMSEPTFPPHPHAGFSAVTYMLPESPGAFRNRDSFGDQSIIHPGDIHWTQAGSGMMHEEVPLQRGDDCLGFQIFVNLSRTHKSLPPRAFHAHADELPKVSVSTSRVTVVVGSFMGESSPLSDLATKVTILDVAMFKNSLLSLELDETKNWFVFVISGEGHLQNANTKIAGRQALLFSQQGKEIRFQTQESELRLLVCGGVPIREPIVWGGPFAMTTQEEIIDAYARYQKGLMGRLQ